MISTGRSIASPRSWAIWSGNVHGRLRPDWGRTVMPSTIARFLMCRPEHFGVDYAINPWMDPTSWARDSETLVDTSQREWAALHRALAGLGAVIELVPPAP